MIWVGTSGWQYEDWRSRFYPDGLPKARWLAHFARRFPTVEINNSFYRLPSAETFARWREETPEGFVIAVKASRFITHIRRLLDCGDSVQLLWPRAQALGTRLGPVLFQLPPHMRRAPALLEGFLRVLPADMQAAFEFRDPSWETDEIFDLLDRARAALVLADAPGARVPQVVTGGWAYLRFHQGARDAAGYSREKLRRWAGRVAELPAKDTFAYFNNDTDGAAVRDAAMFTQILRESGLDVAGRAL